jgi:4-hydroxy-tetrahydrodipicolinate reductase
MGTVARGALASCGEYCCGLSHTADPQNRIFTNLDELWQCNPGVLLDLTTQPASYEISRAAVERRVPTVVGASGWTDEQRASLATIAAQRNVGVLLVPNFSVGAMLMMRFAQEAAQFFGDAEIVEIHHPAKKDKPSGTARETARRIEAAKGNAPTIHSIRLTGSLAHQEVVFGGPGERLTIRHDSLSRESFVDGMMRAVHAVVHLRGLSVGLESL